MKMETCNNVNFKGSISKGEIWNAKTRHFETPKSDEEYLKTYDKAIKMLGDRERLSFNVEQLINNDPEIKEKLSKIPNNYSMEVSIEVAGNGNECHNSQESILYNPEITVYNENEDEVSALVLNEDSNTSELKAQISKWLDSQPKAKEKQDKDLSITYTDELQSIQSDCELITGELKAQKLLLAELLNALNNNKELKESISNLPNGLSLNIMGNSCIFEGGATAEEFKNNGFYKLYLYHCKDFDESNYKDFEIELPITSDKHLDEKALVESINNIELKKA